MQYFSVCFTGVKIDRGSCKRRKTVSSHRYEKNRVKQTKVQDEVLSKTSELDIFLRRTPCAWKQLVPHIMTGECSNSVVNSFSSVDLNMKKTSIFNVLYCPLISHFDEDDSTYFCSSRTLTALWIVSLDLSEWLINNFTIDFLLENGVKQN